MKKLFYSLYSILVLLIYLLTACFIVAFCFAGTENDVLFDAFTNSIIALGSILIIFMIVTIGLNLVFMKKIDISPRFIMTIKLSLIPFYIFFFVVGIMLIVGFLSPYLWFPIIFAYLIGGFFGYLTLLTTSMPNIIMLVRKLLAREKDNLVLTIISLVLHFIFVVDIIGSIIFNCYYRRIKQNITNNDSSI